MEDRGQTPPEIAQLQERADKFATAATKLEHISATIGTPDFQGPEKYIPPTPDHPNYLKELIATTLASSRVNDAILHRSLPALEELQRSLKEKIADRQQLLSDAAEYTMNLHELRELEGKGALTNQSVIGMVEEALRKIDEELHPSVLTSADQPEKNPPEHAVAPPVETPHKSSETQILQEPGIDSSKLHALQLIANGGTIEGVLDALNQTARYPFSETDAERLINALFTKLYSKITEGDASAAEVDTWSFIRGATTANGSRQMRNEFREKIYDFFHPEEFQPTAATPKPTPITRERAPKREFDALVIVDAEIAKYIAKNRVIDMRQRFKPNAANEAFGFHSDDSDRLQHDGTLKLEPSSNDHHMMFTFADGLTTAILKNKKWNRQQREEIMLAILQRVDEWEKEHPLPSAK